MKAPTEKRNDTIQLVVTTACDLACSNCTELLPFRRDYRHMSVDVFREGLRSLRGWHGVRGVFGGNPVLHPQFEDLMQVLIEEVPEQRQRGLWCNNLHKHGQLIRDVFYPNGRFNLNAHGDPKAAAEIERWLPGKLIRGTEKRTSWHSPILLDWQDMGLSEREWIESRESCDINQEWSGAILERDGEPWGYFCEVAGALDGIRGENHGVPAVPGWWQKGMGHFETQVRQCCDRGCGVPLRRLGHRDSDQTYDYSKSWDAIVELRLSKRTRGERHETLPVGTDRATDYAARWTEKPR